MRIDEGAVDRAVPEQQVQQSVEQRDVGARQDRQVQVGLAGGVGTARIDHDHAHRGLASGLARSTCALDTPIQDRMRPRRIGTRDQQQVGMVDVLVGAGRGVRAEALAMPGDGR